MAFDEILWHKDILKTECRSKTARALLEGSKICEEKVKFWSQWQFRSLESSQRTFPFDTDILNLQSTNLK